MVACFCIGTVTKRFMVVGRSLIWTGLNSPSRPLPMEPSKVAVVEVESEPVYWHMRNRINYETEQCSHETGWIIALEVFTCAWADGISLSQSQSSTIQNGLEKDWFRIHPATSPLYGSKFIRPRIRITDLRRILDSATYCYWCRK